VRTPGEHTRRTPSIFQKKKKKEEIDFFFFRKYFPFIGRKTKKEKETQTNPLCPKFNKPTFIKKKKKKRKYSA
jgi:hypothetical protein